MNRMLLLLTSAIALLGCVAAHGCNRQTTPAAADPTPSLRLYVLSTMAGAMEPCGCRKDMLGGVDHAAAMIQAEAKEAPRALLVGAGPMLFANPTIDEQRREQDAWKAEGIAESLADLHLAAWAPGLNDFAHGADALAKLGQRSGATLLAANADASGVTLEATRVVDVGGRKIGLAGISLFDAASAKTRAVQITDGLVALESARTALVNAGAQIRIGLIAAPRGDALRLAERAKGFHVFVLGKAQDSGDGNDHPTEAVVVDGTLIVQAPNHLQAIGVVDLFVRGDELTFADGSGLEAAAKKSSLDGRIAELRKRITEWEASGKVSASDVIARKADLSRLEAERKSLDTPTAAPTGSFFRYQLREVREKLGSSPQIASRMSTYYQRVNEHNREAFKDRKPPPVEAGAAEYLGTAACASCHQEENAVWQKTQHAHAYQTLVTGHKEFNLDCVSCHVTGYERPGGSTVTFVDNLKDVQCEQCHGPGSLHVKDEKYGFITGIPAQSVCQGCHHPPHVADDWSVDAAWPKILGPGHGRPSEKPAP